FVMEVVGVAVAVVFLTSTFPAAVMPWEPVEAVRRGVAILVVALASIAIVWMQYFGRRVAVSRGLGIGAGIAAGVLFASLLAPSAFALRSTMAPIPESLALVRSDGGPQLPSMWLPSSRVMVAIPVEIKGMPASARFHVEALTSEIAGAGA